MTNIATLRRKKRGKKNITNKCGKIRIIIETERQTDRQTEKGG